MIPSSPGMSFRMRCLKYHHHMKVSKSCTSNPRLVSPSLCLIFPLGSQLRISKFKTQLCSPALHPQSVASLFLHICSTFLLQPKNFFCLCYIQTSNSVLSFVSKVCPRSTRFPPSPLPQSSMGHCLSLLPASPATCSPASASSTLSTIHSLQAILH